MASKSSPRRQTRDSLDAETSERARIVAAFMGLLVEQSISNLDFGQVAAGADVSIAQLREEFGSTIDALTAHVEEMDRLVLSGAEVEKADRAHCLAMLLASVLRAWLKGEDPNLARTMSAIERAGVWKAARRPARPRLPHWGLQLPPAPQRRHRADQDKVGAQRSWSAESAENPPVVDRSKSR